MSLLYKLLALTPQCSLVICKIGILVLAEVWLVEKWSPKDVHYLIPSMCKYVTLNGKKGFTMSLRLWTLR